VRGKSSGNDGHATQNVDEDIGGEAAINMPNFTWDWQIATEEQKNVAPARYGNLELSRDGWEQCVVSDGRPVILLRHIDCQNQAFLFIVFRLEKYQIDGQLASASQCESCGADGTDCV
jgi:hypothetical protein